MKTAVRVPVNAMDGNFYFRLLTKLMKDNPPTAEDAAVVATMAKIGLVPGQDFDVSNLDPAVGKAIQAAPKEGQQRIAEYLPKVGRMANGWIVPSKTGIYGTDYLNRATVTWFGLGANRPQDAIYPTSEFDADKKQYDGSKHYVMHFDKGQLPPVNGFWSLTMYDAKYFFVPNSLNRFTLSERDKLKQNPDGSVDFYIQNESPGARMEAN
jgi:hypothetical protein